MSAARQLVAVQFNPWDRRDYTYHTDGDPVAIGDRVIVTTERGDSSVTVMSLPTETPQFATKPIVGLAPSDDLATKVARMTEI
jgi:hypothetical protein